MSLTLRLTGTGGAQLVPVFGCDCAACRRARREESHRRRPCSGVVTFNSAVTLLDAGRPDLMEHHPAGSFQQVLLTHYHLDHVQGYFRCAGESARRFRSMARRMTPAATICSNTPVCLTLAIPSRRL